MKLGKQLRKVSCFAPLFRIRDWFMDRMGLFKLKRRIKSWLWLKKACRNDKRRRRLVSMAIMQLPNAMLHESEACNIVVSMTSHGKRVENMAPYAIYSILCQEKMPNKIILNIDKVQWNDENIPVLLKELQRAGVEICFVDDVGPHTKLLPTLEKCPNDIIITVDDDVYYDATMISELYEAYKQSDGKSVVCREGKAIVKKEGKFLPYSQQPEIYVSKDYSFLMPFGVAGVLYPPHIFSKEVFNKNVFQKLCRHADDIWFGIMEFRDGIHIIYVPSNYWSDTWSVDHTEEYVEAGSSALRFQNDFHEKNDIQFRALLDFYQLD